MVKSGLKSEIVENGQVPRVSAYRLASHLGSAFVLYGLLANGAINILSPISGGSGMKLGEASVKALQKFKSKAHGLAALAFFTALSGAFVAGLDAGLIYNEFPTMGGSGRFIPSDLWDSKLGLRNIFENPTCVQFNHRILAISTVTGISVLWFKSRKLAMLPKPIKLLCNALMIAAWGQGSLGVLTLVNEVPIPLASAHQAGSVGVLTFALWLVNRLKYLKH
jgi:heme a synthase